MQPLPSLWKLAPCSVYSDQYLGARQELGCLNCLYSLVHFLILGNSMLNEPPLSVFFDTRLSFYQYYPVILTSST